MSNCNNNSNRSQECSENSPACDQYNSSGRRFNRADINAYVAAGNVEQQQQNSNRSQECSGNPGDKYNTSGRRFNRADINAYVAAGNAEQQQQNSNRSQECSGNHGDKYNTSGRRFNRADLNAYVAGGNAEQRQNSNRAQECSGNPGDKYNTSGRRFNRADLNAYVAGGNAELQNCNTTCFSQNHSCTQDITDSCSPGERYNTSGRPFTRADLSAFAVNTSNLITETCSHEASQGRGASAHQSFRSRNNLAQTAPLARHIDHEEEMARNQRIALNRLRAEQTIACGTPSRSALRSKKAPPKCKTDQAHIGCSRGREFDPQDETARQKAKGNVGFGKKGRNVLTGRRLDVDKLVDYNIQSCEVHRAVGRRMDVDRDLTNRRLNLPSSKGQRASSCPTPMSSVPQCSPAPRPAPTCPSPNRSPNNSRSSSPNCPNTARIPARCPATPTICPPPSEAPPCNVTVTTTTRTSSPPVTPPIGSPNRNNSPPRNIIPTGSPHLDPTYGSPPQQGLNPRTPLTTPVPYPGNTSPQPASPSFQNSYNITNSSQPQSPLGITNESTGNYSTLNSTFPNTTYGSSGPSSPETPPYRPSRLNFVPIEMPGALSPSEMINYWQYHSDLLPRIQYSGPTTDFMYEPSYEDDEPGGNLRGSYPNVPNSNQCSPPAGQIECPPESFVDLTDDTVYDSPVRQETQYVNQTMDLTGQDITNGPSANINPNCRPSPTANCPEGSWPIPQEDITCTDRNNYPNRLNSTMNATSNGNSFRIDDLLGPDCDYEARNKNYLLNRSCPTEVQTGPACPPRANLFRCLAKKLSSTYDFLSSFVTNSDVPKSQCASSPPECSQPSSGQNSCPYSSFNDSTGSYGLERLFETQYNPNTTTGTPGSITECANAKRCGRVHFDNSDGSQDPQLKAIRKAQIESLVSDSFCPGLIQATVDGLENFNNLAFNITLGKDAKDTTKCDRPPPEEPMTLLEAFSVRIDQERESINKQLPNNVAADQVVDIIDKQFADKFPTDLNRSIKCLLLSERTKEHEQVEQAKEKSFESDVQKVRTTFPVNPKIKIDVYTGHTIPSND